MLRRAYEFCRDVVINTGKRLFNLARGLYQHAEAAAILVLASIGLTTLLSEIPFRFSVPMWIELPMVIPVLAVIGILVLSWSADWRAQRRLDKTMNMVANAGAVPVG